MSFIWCFLAVESEAQIKIPPPSRFYLPEAPRQQHKLILQELEKLGVERYIPPNTQDDLQAQNDEKKMWSFVSSEESNKNIALVWSIAAEPPYKQLSLTKDLKSKLNHFPIDATRRITSSDELWQYILAQQKRHGKFHFQFLPQHFVLPRDQAKFDIAFEETIKKVKYEMKRQRDAFIYQRYLIKPLQINGNEVSYKTGQMFIKKEELETLKKENPPQVQVSQYIEPYLIDGHKFQVGFYVTLTSLNPIRFYVHHHALVKIAKKPYARQMDKDSNTESYTFDDDAFIPPWDFKQFLTEFLEFPSEVRPGTNAWGVVKQYMIMKGIDTFDIDQSIDNIIRRVLLGVRGYFQQEIKKLQGPKEENFFELWKFDFEIDDMGKPWLLKIHSNPSMAPEATVFGTDEAIKKMVLFDTLNLVGVHPQSRNLYEDFIQTLDETKKNALCHAHCKDTTRVWDTTCWQCPGWFEPYVAEKLFESMQEYSRRGRYRLLFPALDDDYSKFLDSPMTLHDQAFNRYLKSISTAISQSKTVAIFDTMVVCVYREHCNHNGDCVNGKCLCDEKYEGTTCYIPKDMERQQREREEKAKKTSWKDRVVNKIWHKTTQPPVQHRSRVGPNGEPLQETTKDDVEPDSVENFSGTKLLMGLFSLTLFLFVASRIFLLLSNNPHNLADNERKRS